MRVKVKIYNGSKYDMNSEKAAEHIYDRIKEVITKEIPAPIMYDLGFDTVDPHDEYTILKFENGSTATFRTSFTDVFRA